MRFPGPYTIYRWYRYTEEENASYYQIKEKHEKIHAKSIFFGAVPVLVAATISSAFSAIITAIIGENDQSEVLFYFFYSLTVAQMIGYYVIYWLPTSIPSYQYYYRIATKHCAFAWKSTLVVVLLDKTLDVSGPSVAILYWCMWLVFGCIIVSISSLVQVRFTRVVETLARAKRFEAEIFALGLSYTLDLIVIAGLCGTDFVSILDNNADDTATSHDPNRWLCYNLSIIYPLVVTFLLTSLHSMGLFEKATAALDEVDKNKVEKDRENQEYADIHRMTITAAHSAKLARESLSGSKITTNNSSSSTSIGSSIAGGVSVSATGSGSGSVNVNVDSGISAELPTHEKSNSVTTRSTTPRVSVDERYSQLGSSIRRLLTPVDAFCCSWDKKRTVNLTLSMMFVVMFGFFCGSSWYAWSILSLHWMLHGQYIISSTLFALLISYAVWRYMVMITFRVENDEVTQHTVRLTNTRRKRNQLLTLAGRLIVGWSWSQVLVELISIVLSRRVNSPSYAWTLAGVRSFIAILVFMCGRQLDLWLGMYQKKETETIRASFAAMDTSSIVDGIDVDDVYDCDYGDNDQGYDPELNVMNVDVTGAVDNEGGVALNTLPSSSSFQ